MISLKEGFWHVYKHILFYQRISSIDLANFETKSKSTTCNDVNYKQPGAIDMLPCSKAVLYCDIDFSPKSHTGLLSYYYTRDYKPFFLAGIISLSTSLSTIPFLNPELSLLLQSQGLLHCVVSLLNYFPSLQKFLSVKVFV